MADDNGVRERLERILLAALTFLACTFLVFLSGLFATLFVRTPTGIFAAFVVVLAPVVAWYLRFRRGVSLWDVARFTGYAFVVAGFLGEILYLGFVTRHDSIYLRMSFVALTPILAYQLYDFGVRRRVRTIRSA